MSPRDEAELKLTEERLARVSVLQELTVAALDLFDPRRSMDDFLDRLAMRLGCTMVVCVGGGDRGGPRLLGATGLSRASRAVPIEPAESLDALVLPFPELARAGLVRWHFRVTQPEAPADRLGCMLLIYFEGEPQLPVQYHGMVERLVEILRSALLHRRLYARTLESERRLFEQKTLLECQSEASLDGILFVSTDGGASYNQRFREIFSLPESVDGFGELVEPVTAHVAAPADMAAQMRRLALCRDEQERTEVILHDGRSFDVVCAPVKSRDGIFFGRSWYLRDITDHKRAELERALLFQQERSARAQAEESRRRSAFLAEASSLLAASLDYVVILEGVAHLAVPTLADWCMVDLLSDQGLTHRVVVAHFDPAKAGLARELKSRFPPDPRVVAGAGRVLIDGQAQLWPTVDGEGLREFVRDPEHLQLLQGLGFGSAVVVPLTARGRRLGVVTLVFGGSGRHYCETDLALAEDLASRVALAVDNARLYQRTQDAVRLRDEFLSIASHELRTPITSLQLAAQGMLRLANSTPIEQIPPVLMRTSLETAVRQASRMAKLIDRLLDVSRIQAGRVELQLEQVELSAVVREIAAQSRADLAQADCDLRLVAPEPVTGLWDRARLEQVVANLLSNAIKYGAGHPIEIEVRREDQNARLVVRDHGIGIPEDYRGRIFERFERAVSARHYSGLGLGLYIVDEVLKALGGKVSVESEVGQGSCFTVELPVTGPMAESAPHAGRDEEGAA